MITIFRKLLKIRIIHAEGFVMTDFRVQEEPSMLIVLSRMENATVNICNYNHAFNL